jgi:hypothetical protein
LSAAYGSAFLAALLSLSCIGCRLVFTSRDRSIAVPDLLDRSGRPGEVIARGTAAGTARAVNVVRPKRGWRKALCLHGRSAQRP